MIDQAKQDYIAVVLKSTKVMDNLIGTGGVVSVIDAGRDIREALITQPFRNYGVTI